MDHSGAIDTVAHILQGFDVYSVTRVSLAAIGLEPALLDALPVFEATIEADLSQNPQLAVMPSKEFGLAVSRCFPKLQSLHLNDCNLREIPEISISGLIEISLRQNQLRNAFGLEMCPGLELIDLRFNRISSIAAFQGLTCLRSLRVLLAEGNRVAANQFFHTRLAHLVPNCEVLDGVLLPSKRRSTKKVSKLWQTAQSAKASSDRLSELSKPVARHMRAKVLKPERTVRVFGSCVSVTELNSSSISNASQRTSRHSLTTTSVESQRLADEERSRPPTVRAKVEASPVRKLAFGSFVPEMRDPPLNRKLRAARRRSLSAASTPPPTDLLTPVSVPKQTSPGASKTVTGPVDTTVVSTVVNEGIVELQELCQSLALIGNLFKQATLKEGSEGTRLRSKIRTRADGIVNRIQAEAQRLSKHADSALEIASIQQEAVSAQAAWRKLSDAADEPQASSSPHPSNESQAKLSASANDTAVDTGVMHPSAATATAEQRNSPLSKSAVLPPRFDTKDATSTTPDFDRSNTDHVALREPQPQERVPDVPLSIDPKHASLGPELSLAGESDQGAQSTENPASRDSMQRRDAEKQPTSDDEGPLEHPIRYSGFSPVQPGWSPPSPMSTSVARPQTQVASAQPSVIGNTALHTDSLAAQQNQPAQSPLTVPNDTQLAWSDSEDDLSSAQPVPTIAPEFPTLPLVDIAAPAPLQPGRAQSAAIDTIGLDHSESVLSATGNELEEEEAPRMIGPFEIIWDDELERYYFYNVDTDESVWELPSDLQADFDNMLATHDA